MIPSMLERMTLLSIREIGMSEIHLCRSQREDGSVTSITVAGTMVDLPNNEIICFIASIRGFRFGISWPISCSASLTRPEFRKKEQNYSSMSSSPPLIPMKLIQMY